MSTRDVKMWIIFIVTVVFPFFFDCAGGVNL